jgi:hypothetical protein
MSDTFTSHIDKKIFLTSLLTPYLYTFSYTIEPSYFELGLLRFLSKNLSNLVRTVVSVLTLIRQNIGKPNNLKVFWNKKAKGHERDS